MSRNSNFKMITRRLIELAIKIVLQTAKLQYKSTCNLIVFGADNMDRCGEFDS